MTELLAGDRPNRGRKGAGGDPVLVTATALARHFGMTQQYVSKLMADGVIERRADGLFDLDACRLAYLKWLRDPARRSARSKADAEHVAAKTELLRIRAMEKRRELRS